MKIQQRLVFLFSILVIAAIGITSYLAVEYTESAVIDSAIQEMKTDLAEKENQIQTLHSRASEDLVFALQNPLFVEYFELPETKAGDVYKDGILQFTERQREIKTKLDQWIYNFQKKFQVDETCLIDTSGQEHTRLVLKSIEIDENLSPDEEFTPFFNPSFEKSKNEVHIQYPYVSPDTNRWVFAYTSPIVLGNGEKPAFYHFEMPVSIFQNLVNVDTGRMYVVDPEGFLIADSQHLFTNSDVPTVPTEYFPSVTTVSTSRGFNEIIQKMKSEQEGIGTYDKNGETHYVIYEKLPTFGWSIVYEKPYSAMLYGNTSLTNLKTTIAIVASVIMAGGLTAVFLISNRITRPIKKLADSCKTLDVKNLVPIKNGPKDEIGNVTRAINSMIERITSNEDEIQRQYEDLQKQTKRSEKLAAIGELASRLTHNLRNPLSVITSTVGIIQATSKDILDEKNKVRLDRITSAASNMTKQIEEVLTFVKNKPLDIETHSLSAIINSAINNIEKPNAVNIRLPSQDIILKCDGNKLQVVFMNLITNAIQAVENKGDVSIRSYVTNNDVIVEVEDSGPGIPDEVLPKVFDSLFTTKPSGTGLGLPYCKTIAEQHGGSISVKTNPTVFTILLPNSLIETSISQPSKNHPNKK